MFLSTYLKTLGFLVALLIINTESKQFSCRHSGSSHRVHAKTHKKENNNNNNIHTQHQSDAQTSINNTTTMNQAVFSSASSLPPNSRMLFEIYYLPIRITGDFTRISGLTTTMQGQIKQLTAVVGQLFADTLSIQRRKGNLFFPFQKEGLTCGGVTVLTTDADNGIANSDLHIYYTYENLSTDTWVADGAACVVQDGDNRSIFGRIIINIAQLSIVSNADFNKYVQLLAHQFIHILGFSQWLFQYWKDANGNPYDSSYFSDSYDFFASETNSIIRTPNLLTAAQSHFRCPYLEGVPLENAGTGDSIGSHFEANAFHDDLMAAKRMTSKQVFSVFDVGLLKDTGWYQVDATKAEVTLWGKNKGCDFLFDVCESSKSFSEFCTTTLNTGCDIQDVSKSICNQQSPYSSTCKYYSESVDCSDSTNFNPLSWSSEYNGDSSRCFKSTLIDLSQPAKTDTTACYQSVCLPNTQVQITVGTAIITCTSSGTQVFSVTGYSGTITCPSDISSFCLVKSTTWSDCSMNGYLNNGQCYCLSGYMGSNCKCKISDQNQYINGIQVLPISSCISMVCLSYSGSVCISCNTGWNLICGACQNYCPTGCMTCSNPVTCTPTAVATCNTCNPNYFLYLGSCVLDCPSSYYSDLASQNCLSCSTLLCDKCENNLCTTCLSTAKTTYTSGSTYVTCSATCGSGYYTDSSNVCHACHAACALLGCYGSLSSQCYMAPIPCLATNIMAATLICISKPSPCYYPITILNNISCCPQMQFQVSTSQCAACLTTTSSLTQIIVQENTCVEACSDGYYLLYPTDFTTSQTAYCLLCDKSCQTCSGSSATNCLTCNSSTFFYRSACISTCPYNTYPLTTIEISSSDSQASQLNSCQECHPACLDCTGPLASDCLNCAIGFKLKYDNSCVNACGLTLYLDYSTYTCESCIPNCDVCDSDTTCQTCSTGYYYKSDTKMCVTDCGYGYVIVEQLRECHACDSNCGYCSLPNDSGACLTCKIVPNNYLNQGKCGGNSSCKPNQTIIAAHDSQGNLYHICTYCDISCATCSGTLNTQCVTCAPFYYLLNTSPSRCVQFCDDQQHYLVPTLPAPYYTCLPCQCLRCSDTGKCLECKQGQYLLGLTCVDTCPSVGYFPDDDNKTCTSCHPNCLECDNDTETGCRVCQTGYVLVLQNQCILSSICLSGYFFDGVSCVQCISNCQICLTSTTCQYCNSGYWYDSSTKSCILHPALTCNISYYFDPALPYACLPCPSPCYSCTSATTCLVFRETCHYTCKDCYQGNSEYACSSCPATRHLQKYLSTPLAGECRCNNGYSDFGDYECKYSVSEQAQKIASIVTQSIQAITSLILAGATKSTEYFLVPSEFSQFVGSLSYLKKHNQVGLDHTLAAFRGFNLNLLLSASFGSSKNGTETRILLSPSYSQTPIRSRDLTKLEAIHGSSDFFIACFANVILLSVVLCITGIFHLIIALKPDKQIIMPEKYQRDFEKTSVIQAYFRVTFPLAIMNISIGELSICSIGQFYLFDHSNSADSYDIAGIILAIITTILILFTFYIEIIRLPKINTEISLASKIYYQTINQHVFLAKRFIGLNNLRKYFYSFLLVLSYNSPNASLSVMLSIEILFGLYVFFYRPFKRSSWNILSMILRAVSIVLLLIFFILVNTEEHSNAQINCAFVYVVIANAFSLLYAMFSIILTYQVQAKKHLLAEILPAKLQQQQQLPVEGIADLSILETDYLKTKVAAKENDKTSINLLDISNNNNGKPATSNVNSSYNNGLFNKTKLNDTNMNKTMSKIINLDDADSFADLDVPRLNGQNSNANNTMNALDEDKSPTKLLSPLKTPAQRQFVPMEMTVQQKALDDYSARKKVLSSLQRSKLIGYAGLKKELDDNLNRQQKALQEMQQQGDQEREIALQRNNYAVQKQTAATAVTGNGNGLNVGALGNTNANNPSQAQQPQMKQQQPVYPAQQQQQQQQLGQLPVPASSDRSNGIQSFPIRNNLMLPAPSSQQQNTVLPIPATSSQVSSNNPIAQLPMPSSGQSQVQQSQQIDLSRERSSSTSQPKKQFFSKANNAGV